MPQILRAIPINLKIREFNIRLVNVYSLAETDSSKNKRDSIYRLLDKVCQKHEKHKQFTVAGDFNGKTSLAFEKCCQNETDAIPNDDCNNNVACLKAFCMSCNCTYAQHTLTT